ncbi:MAG TPA: TetR/AcrR family transcriptional regulator [Polyangia bacterium]|nr:TetR/AcrR family transcriptional regulator [Polyangia bacterium]
MKNGKRNPDKTRERILQAALHDFAAHGYSGARVERIRQRARTNARMIYHYFGDKSRLYVAVLEHVIGELRQEELRLKIDQIDPVDGLLELFEFVDHHFATHPQLMTLLSGENLLRGKFLRNSAKTPIISSPLMPLIEELLRRGEREGSVRPHVDPLQLYVVMVALCYFHRSNAHTLSFLFRTDLSAPAWQDEHKRIAVDLLTGYLRVGRSTV